MPNEIQELKEKLQKLVSERDEVYNALLKTQKDFESLKHSYNKVHSEYIQKVNECQHWRNEFDAALANGKKRYESIEFTYRSSIGKIMRDLDHLLKEKYPRVDRKEIEELIQNLLPVSVHY